MPLNANKIYTRLTKNPKRRRGRPARRANYMISNIFQYMSGQHFERENLLSDHAGTVQATRMK